MDKILGRLFDAYLSEQQVVARPEYAALTRQALAKEQELRARLDEGQTRCFEALFELTSQIHFLEVKDAFYSGCRLGAGASRELVSEAPALTSDTPGYQKTPQG
ncbi:MAG: hypothetical protein E7541_06285 [Ruminococcaceae bacterium]|nr:hypothetical protein [Oscillospiraceae bacterium]